MLKNIPPIISPELLKVLCEMGHGDRLVIGDGNFPSASMGKNAKVIRMDGHNVPEVLDAILQLFPLDCYVEKPVSLMEVMPMTAVLTASAISSVLLSMKRLKKPTALSLPAKKRSMPTSCCRKE